MTCYDPRDCKDSDAPLGCPCPHDPDAAFAGWAVIWPGILAAILVSLFWMARCSSQSVVAMPSPVAAWAEVTDSVPPNTWSGTAWTRSAPPSVAWVQSSPPRLTFSWLPTLQTVWGLSDFAAGPATFYVCAIRLPARQPWPQGISAPWMPEPRLQGRTLSRSPWGSWIGAWPSWKVQTSPQDWAAEWAAGHKTCSVPLPWDDGSDYWVQVAVSCAGQTALTAPAVFYR